MDWGQLSRRLFNDNDHPVNVVTRVGEEPDYGLHTLVPKDSEADECVDIIAVHGLNGHHLKTWTDPKTGVNWLKDIIPKHIPTARVMSFWYNSKVQLSKSTSDIATFSHQLLMTILAEREGLRETNRPIIFICHSLGGLVFKQALVRSFESDQYHMLGHRIHGVMFFGTPHRGSDYASWGSMAGKTLKVTSFNTSTNTRLTRDLEPSSRVLSYISAAFLHHCDKLQIVSCFETQKMDYMSSLVVEQGSATLGLPAETILPLDGNHRTICHFSDLDAAQFRPVKTALETMVRKAKSSQTTSLRESDAFLEYLGTSDYVDHKNRNSPPVEGTCTWILTHPAYSSWIESTKSSLLWISADPGCGKSVLAAFLVDHISMTSSMRGVNLCYFFFKTDNIQQSDGVNGVKALLHQLYTQQKELVSPAMTLLSGAKMEDIDMLWQALMLSTQMKEARNTICIIDGLDECDKSMRGRLMNRIAASFSTTSVGNTLSTKTGAPGKGDNMEAKIKVLITSRPENQLKIAFQSYAEKKKRESKDEPHCSIIRLRGEDETDAISDDITKVVNAKVDDLIYQGVPVEIIDTVRTELIERADRTFLWVSLILNLLEQKVEAGASRRELDDLLKNRDIYRIYSELLASCSDSPRARKMLLLIVAATRPLTVEELSVALAIEPEEDTPRVGRTTFDDIEYDLVYPFENHIKSLCGHFIRIIRQSVYLVHETAREFLLATETDSLSRASTMVDTNMARPDPQTLFRGSETYDFSSFQHTLQLEEARMLMLKICATYIYCLGRSSRCAERGEASQKTEPFLAYAAKSLAVHFHQVLRDGGNPNVAYFQNLCHPLFPGYKRWIEAFWYPKLPFLPQGDEGQDYYIQLFRFHAPEQYDADDENGLGSGRNSDGEDDEASSSDLDAAMRLNPREPKNEESYRNDRLGIPFSTKLKQDLLQPGFQDATAAYSNPSSLGNQYFPLRVDRSGFVSLDFKGGARERQKGASQSDFLRRTDITGRP